VGSMKVLKKGDFLPGGSVCTELYTKQPDWQIWRTDRGFALVISAGLLEDWMEKGQVEPGFFLPMTEDLHAAETQNYEIISSAEFGPYPETGIQAMEIARAFMRTRQADIKASLSRAFFLPQLPYLLSGSGAGETERDPWTLGSWLTGGVNVPFTDKKRMLSWIPGMTEDLYQEIMQGLNWEETAPERIREASREENQTFAPAMPRRERDPSKPFLLPGREKLERFFRERIIDVIDREDAYRRMGISFPGPTLLIGPPGCGKTYAVEKLSEYLGWPVYTVDSNSIASSYLHESSRLIFALFRQAEENAPSIVIMDEMEAWLSARGGTGNMGQAHSEEVAEFLRALPSLAEKKVLLFAMTNLPDQIDPAIRRKGRFDYTLEVEMPSKTELVNLLSFLLRDIPVEQDLDLSWVAEKLKGRPISDAVFLVRESGRFAVIQEKERIDNAVMKLALDELNRESNNWKKQRIIGFQ